MEVKTMNPKRLSNDFVSRVKAAANLVEVVGEHVVLRKVGTQYTGLCPFHNERSPSFSVSESKQVYHCYGCKKGGDVVSFLTDLHGMSFIEAVEELAERSKIALPAEWNGSQSSQDPKVQAQREKVTTGFRLNRFAAAFFHKELSKSPSTEKYFKDRGVHSELIRSFYLGYAPNAWEGLAEHLQKAKAPLELAQELGLIAPSQKAGVSKTGSFDLFRNRATFPILDLRGRVVGFGGRTLDPDQTPKYLNSKDSNWFHKSKIAYGLFQAQKHARETDTLILVEGYFDVLALHAAGFTQTVATCGTALTIEHLKLFKRFATKIIVLFDGDRAGREATEKAMLLGISEGALLHGVHLPDKVDPDEFLWDAEKKALRPDNIDWLKKEIERSTPILDQRMKEAFAASEKDPESKTNAVKDVQGWLKALKDPVAREIRIQEAVKYWGLSDSFFRDTQGQNYPGGGAMSTNRSSPAPFSPRPAPAARQAPQNSNVPGMMNPPSAQPTRIAFEAIEQKALYGLLFYPNEASFHSTFETLALQFEKIDGIAEIFADSVLQTQIRIWLTEPRPVSTEWLTQQLGAIEIPALRVWLTEIATEHFAKPTADESLSCLLGLVRSFWARFSHLKKVELKSAERQKNADLQAKLMQEYLDLQRRIKEFSKIYDQIERV